MNIFKTAKELKTIGLVFKDGQYAPVIITTKGDKVVSMDFVEEYNVKAVALEAMKKKSVELFFSDMITKKVNHV